jgi:hypothetical protein
MKKEARRGNQPGPQLFLIRIEYEKNAVIKLITSRNLTYKNSGTYYKHIAEGKTAV